MASTNKIPLPSFLKLLTSNSIPAAKAMAVAGKIYKDFNTPAMLSQLTDVKMKAVGIDDKDLRKSVLAAFRKAGYQASPGKVSNKPRSQKAEPSSRMDGGTEAGPSTVQVLTTPPKNKRKRDSDLNEPVPDGLMDEASRYGNMEFNEVLDEEVLKTKSTVVNRAPLMTAWAMVVAERLGFQREEALSIANVYTEMNAISKGVSLGIFESSKNKGMEATRGGSQPYVDIMGRRVALYQSQAGQWRALANNNPAQPSTAFSYISRALRQTTSYVLGALRLLANSYGPQELNEKGYGLYAEFRPDVEGWGGRGELRCDKILDLRRKAIPGEITPKTAEVCAEGSTEGFVSADEPGFRPPEKSEAPERKKPRGLSLEEHEATLDQDTTFNDVDLDLMLTIPVEDLP